MNTKSWWAKHRKAIVAIVLLTPTAGIGLAASLIYNLYMSEIAAREQAQQYIADKHLLMELSGNKIISVIKHQERALYIISSPLPKDKLCGIIRKHRDVSIKEMYYVTPVKKKLTCEVYI